MTDPLKILHVTRAPVGGIFRHIVDLARGQVAQGHRVGIVCDSTTGGERAKAALDALAPDLALGVTRFAIPREPSPKDPFALARLARRINDVMPDVLHGHGAKGAAFARMSSAAPDAIRVYTPHGGSLHYGPHTLAGIIYGALERFLMARTDLFLFESAFARDRYLAAIGTPRSLVRVVCNGVTPAEFEPVIPAAGASDVAYVGEFRHIKGADVLIDAVARLNASGRATSLTLAGDGEESAKLHEQVQRLGLADSIRFAGFQPARTGFSLGRLLVVPSRGDSLPYVVIEAAAAAVPMIATSVGGIPEIFGTQADRLVAPQDPDALAQAIATALDHPASLAASATALRSHVQRHFSQDAMVSGVVHAYREALTRRHGNVTAALTLS